MLLVPRGGTWVVGIGRQGLGSVPGIVELLMLLVGYSGGGPKDR